MSKKFDADSGEYCRKSSVVKMFFLMFLTDCITTAEYIPL